MFYSISGGEPAESPLRDRGELAVHPSRAYTNCNPTLQHFSERSPRHDANHMFYKRFWRRAGGEPAESPLRDRGDIAIRFSRAYKNGTSELPRLMSARMCEAQCELGSRV